MATSEPSFDPAHEAYTFLVLVGVLQGLAAVWAALNALIATEMSVLLAVAGGAYSLTAGWAAVMLIKRRVWAFWLSVMLAVAVIALGLVLCGIVKEAPFLGIAHVRLGWELALAQKCDQS